MNRYADELGMDSSHFVNATGLPAADHYSTARDLAVLARAIDQLLVDLHMPACQPLVAPVLHDAGPRALAARPPVASLEQWNDLRARLVSTPGVSGVDLSSLSARGAVVRLNYSVSFPDLQAELADRRLDLALRGETWVIQPY